ncbi:MAG: bifunctional (p)ppGpp synthetase/guanosine-3',5'-bis(diphosphate) 3'-pyrophosphohydrolase [Nitrospirae bacterium]|nr:bifunctional (p)ppGpp synthetase/guanosine-3',5'-bis(diphosphate) 3'-pyrophosphohydrolase [Candidatus Troglogloeales bacterium]
MSLDEIERCIRLYAPNADLSLLSKAYTFSSEAHFGQVRISGEPYHHHPLEVALILTQLKLPPSSIIAGLLHDVLEDTTVTKEQLCAEFGEEAATLVEGVTKIGQIAFKSLEEKQAENFRKMVVSVAQDFRVLLIKLADRLHNMRTLHALPEEKQKRIAQETMEIYAPLANRLGIGWMKSELEDCALRYLKPDIYQTLVKKVEAGLSARTTYIETVIEEVRSTLAANGINGKIYGRTKHFVGIYQKMMRRGIPFEEVYDLMGIRILTDSRMNCYAILGIIHSLWPPIPSRFKDYIAIPKPNLYQSIHTTVVGPEGQHVEFQIRTEEMHKLAEEGIAAHWVYKEGGPVREKDEKTFAWLRQLVEWEQDITDTRQFMDSVKSDLFGDMVYIYTPQGDVKELLRGSTPIDFAYAVHTEVGNHCVGAKVNGKMAPLGYILNSGERVEILTSPNHLPNRNWLKLVKTPKAKAKIKHFILTTERTKSLEIGRKLLERELKKAQLNPKEVLNGDQILNGVKPLGIHTLEDLFAGIGYGKIRAASVIAPLLPEPHFKTEAPKEIKKNDSEKGAIKVKGLGDIMVHISSCCTPVPGDEIIGFVTRGRGVSVHSRTCPNIDHFTYNQDRLIEVSWERAAGITHCVDISVLTVDQPGVLGAVSTAISQDAANISRAEIVTTQDQKATLKFSIQIRDATHLQQVLNHIEKVEGVLRVRRVRKEGVK